MLNNALPDIAVGGVLYDVSDIVDRACRPVATVGAQRVSDGRVAVGIKT